jgi:hypothetical protein
MTNSRFKCCESPNIDASWDMEHASGLDFDMEHCSRCNKYTMFLWTPHGMPETQTQTIEVKEDDADILLALHERKMVGVRLYRSGKLDEAKQYFSTFWNKHRKVLNDWLDRQGFDW